MKTGVDSFSALHTILPHATSGNGFPILPSADKGLMNSQSLL
jgi:hypothetical protein